MSARGMALALVVCLGIAVGLLLVAGASARAALPTQFGSEGEGAGAFDQASGIAVNQQSGDLYITDRNNSRVDEFTAEGMFLRAWGWGVADGKTMALQVCTTECFTGFVGAGAGQFGNDSAEYVAVDNSMDLSRGDVYVVDTANHRVEKFGAEGEFLLMFGGEVDKTTKGDVCLAGEECQAGKEGTGPGEFSTSGGVAVGPTGTVYVGDVGRVQKFSPSGGYEGQVDLLSASQETTSVVVNAAGDVYAGGNEYGPTGTLLHTQRSAHSLGEDGDVFSSAETADHIHHVFEFDEAGAEMESFDEGQDRFCGGMVWSEPAKRLYEICKEMDSPERVRLVSLPAPGPLVVGVASAGGVESTAASLEAMVNPEGHATKYRFEYGLSESYGTSVPVKEGSLAAGFEDEPVQASVQGLAPDTTYHYRVVATDSEGHVTDGPDVTFTTLPAVSIDEVDVSEVADTSATFGAELDPLGVEATYRLEYGTSTAYGTVVTEGGLAQGSEDVTVGPVHVQGLTPNTLYHYRVVAFDEREGVSYTVEGADHTFTTQPLGSEMALLDGRQWELVSPLDSHGARFSSIAEGGLVQSSALGDAMTYLATVPTEAEPKGYHEEVQVLSQRGSTGWSSQDIATAHRVPSGPTLDLGEEYRFFSEDLSLALVEPDDEETFSSLAPEVFPPDTETTVYLRHDATCRSEPSTCYMPLVTGAPGYADVPPGTVFGKDPQAPALKAIRFMDATPDLGHAILESDVALTSSAGGEGIYEWSAGMHPSEELQLVNVLPDGSAAGRSFLGSTELADDTRDAISADGARVFWSTENQPQHLYMRDTVKGETIQLDVPEPDAPKLAILGARPAPEFQFANSNGTEVFFTDTQPLTEESSDTFEGADLYECVIVETAGRDECVLTDLTPATAGVRPAGVVGGVIGASENGSYLYFVADSVLTDQPNAMGERAAAGSCTKVLPESQPAGATCNLYMLHYDQSSGEWEAPVLVGRLSGEDATDWHEAPFGLTMRVSPNGQWLAFMSDRSLTGYDNHDANSGAPDEEVYLYHAEIPTSGGAVAGKLVCASCDPSGARPVGVEWTQLKNGLASGGRLGWSNDTWLAAGVPGWTSAGKLTTLHQSRYLSDEGRLFFNSNDALVPQDIDGTEDVYEYEPADVGSCETVSSTFSGAAGGCIDLISSGTSSSESAFLDASESGDDVFFLTSEKLVPQAKGSGVALYDAHVCTTASPCYKEPAPPAECDTADACRAAPTPQPSVFGTPSSATFSGIGNLVSSSGSLGVASKAKAKGKSLSRAQKLKLALEACRRKVGRKQAACVRSARKRYGTKPAAKKVRATKRGVRR